MTYRKRFSGMAIGMAISLLSSVGFGLDVELPTSPDNWVNSAPLSNETLKGKGVYLVFFEET